MNGEDVLDELEGETVEEANFDLGSIVLELENGSQIKLYDQSGIGIEPKLKGANTDCIVCGEDMEEGHAEGCPNVPQKDYE